MRPVQSIEDLTDFAHDGLGEGQVFLQSRLLALLLGFEGLWRVDDAFDSMLRCIVAWLTVSDECPTMI